ncbi:hypothetical protein K3712_000530 [Escherichia coli]|nr:hypothetical protein [Escherichia coli]
MLTREFVNGWFEPVPEDFKEITECSDDEIAQELGITQQQAFELGVWLVQSKMANIWRMNLEKAVRQKLPDQYEEFLDTGLFVIDGVTYTEKGNEVKEAN